MFYSEDKIEIADWALRESLRLGAQNARVELSCIDNLTVQCEDTDVSTLQQSSGCGLVFRLFVDGRYGTCSTNRLEKGELTNLIRNGIACTRLLTPDADRTLPDPSRYYRAENLAQNEREILDLQSFKPNNPNIDAVQMACQVARPVIGQDPRLIHLSTYLASRGGWQYIVDSQDFRGLLLASNSVAYSTASLRDKGDSRPSDSWMQYAVSLEDLQPLIGDLGQKALTAAQQRIGATSVKAGRYDIAIEPTCLMKLLNPMLSAMQDGALHAHRSFLERFHLGEKITSPMLTINDEPQRKGSLSACLFDFEGVATRFTPIIRQGHLCEWFIGTYLGNKMHMTPHISGPNVLCIEPGTQSRQQVLDSLADVILITGFLGGNSNDVTGDFSFGIEGQLYRHGERVRGVAGVNLTGNMLDFWNSLSHVCNDVENLPDGLFPTLFFHDIQIA